MESMEQLAALLEDNDTVDELELGELYREMVQRLKPRAKLAKVGEDNHKTDQVLPELKEMVRLLQCRKQ
jgi:hypothetical protein